MKGRKAGMACGTAVGASERGVLAADLHPGPGGTPQVQHAGPGAQDAEALLNLEQLHTGEDTAETALKRGCQSACTLDQAQGFATPRGRLQRCEGGHDRGHEGRRGAP